MGTQGLPDFSLIGSYRADSPLFMMKTKNSFHRMGKGAVTDIVEKSGGLGGRSIFGADLVALTQAIENAGHQMQGAQAVSEARMFGALIGIKAQAELLYTSQSLEFGRIDQPDHEPPVVRIRSQTDNVMDRISIDSFGHQNSLKANDFRAVFYHPVPPNSCPEGMRL